MPCRAAFPACFELYKRSVPHRVLDDDRVKHCRRLPHGRRGLVTSTASPARAQGPRRLPRRPPPPPSALRAATNARASTGCSARLSTVISAVSGLSEPPATRCSSRAAREKRLSVCVTNRLRGVPRVGCSDPSRGAHVNSERARGSGARTIARSPHTEAASRDCQHSLGVVCFHVHLTLPGASCFWPTRAASCCSPLPRVAFLAQRSFLRGCSWGDSRMHACPRHRQTRRVSASRSRAARQARLPTFSPVAAALSNGRVD